VTALGTTVLAGTHYGDVYRSTGSGWTHLGRAPAGVHRLAINPTNPQLVYAAIANGSYNYNLYASTDGGTTWATSVAWPSDLLGVQDIAFSVAVPGRLYVAGDGRVVWTTGDGSPKPVYTTGAVGLDVRDLYVVANAAGRDDRCFVASDQGPAVAEQCSVAGSHVIGLGHGLSIGLVTDFAMSPDGRSLVAMLQDFRAASSADGGATWVAAPATEDGYAAVNPALPALCYAFRQSFFRSTDGCRTFTRTGMFASSVATTANNFAFDPDDPQTFYVVAATPAGIQRTTTGGAGFTLVSWPFPSPTLVAIGPHNAQHILVAESTVLRVSFDGGTTWTNSTNMPATGQLTVAISPRDDSTVLGAVYRDSTVTTYRSADGGQTFAALATTLSTAQGGHGLGGVVYSPSTTAPLAVVTTSNGAFLSVDDGDHWRRLDATTTTHRITAAHFADGYLYLGTYGQGVLRSTTRVE
jgi:hypothetical protein